MRDLSPRHSSHAARGSHHQEESTFSRDLNVAIINTLHKEFPGANKELIADMYQLCHGNLRETREQLRDFGFLKSGGSHQHQPQQQQHQQHPLEPQQPQPAPKPELSEGQKRQLANQLKVQFSKLDANVINIALTTCDYRIEETKRLLEAWNQRQSPPRNTSASSSGTSSSVVSSANLEPAALPSASENSPRALTAGASSIRPTPARNSASGPSQVERGRHTVAGPSRAERIASASQQLKASDVTKKRPSKGTGRKQTVVVTSQPMSGGHVTSPSHRTAAKGPDADLRKGPDSSLLITDYEPAQGPDRSLRQGPDHGRAFGPLGAKGSDPSLRCGPQSSLLQNHGVANLRAVETHI